MDGTEAPVVDPARKKRRKCLLLVGATVLLLAVVLAVVLGVILTAKSSETSDFKSDVMNRCKRFIREHGGTASKFDCEEIWGTFEKAYIGKDPCDVPPEAYDPLFNSVKDAAACNTTLFWSKTNTVVHAFTENRDCLVTLEDTLLGFMFNGLTWCSKKESNETFTEGCPGWSDCKTSPVQSFWLKASANFATTACGSVSAMLNGSLDTPFSTSSIFASVEVKNLNPDNVKSLTILLVTKNTDTTTCNNLSFNDLKSSLNAKIAYNCREVP
ncbi:ADP-ribosyl cyclase/cyclic ADP-ribose hydrolase 1-like, partial [Clarias magur]